MSDRVSVPHDASVPVQQVVRGQVSLALPTRASKIPRVRPVMQALLGASERSPEKRAAARDAVVVWANERWPGILDENAMRGADFEYDQPGFKVTSLSLESEDLWCFRVEHQDSDSSQSRNWVIEALVTQVESGDLVAVKTQCSTTSDRDVPASSPRFLRSWLEQYQLYDGRWPVSARPITIRSGTGVSRLVELIRGERSLPVVVFAENLQDDVMSQAARVIRRVCGLGHVVVVAGDYGDYLNELIGKDGAITQGGVRTYWPGFGAINDAQSHVLAERNRIKAWRSEEGIGAGAFDDFLVRQLHKYSVSDPQKLEQVPSIASIRRQKAENERARQSAEIARLRGNANQNSDLRTRELELTIEESSLELQLLKDEIDEAKRQQNEWMQVAQDRDDAAQAMGQKVEALRAQNVNLHTALQRYRAGAHIAVAIPATLEELPEWADEHYADRIILLPRAKRAVKTAAFLNVPLVYQSLQLLAIEYWNLRTAEPAEFPSAHLAFESRKQAVGVDEAPSISVSRLGEFEDAYTVKYLMGGRSTQVLDRHIRGGSNTKDDRYCLRIYFFWDDEAQKVVVGHLPSHLDTRAT